jgi:uncharacterized alpha-E superfamily protein
MSDETLQNELGGLDFVLTAWTEHGRLPQSEETGQPEDPAGILDAALRKAVFDPENPRSIISDIGRVERISMAVRDRLSHDSWRIVHALRGAFAKGLEAPTAQADDRLAALDDLLLLLLSFSGQTMDGMTRDNGWRFLEFGRRIERAADLCDVILHALAEPDDKEDVRLSALLEIGNSAMTYRSRYVFGPDAAPVLDLLLADESNPRSVASQIASLYEHIRSLRLESKAKHSGEQRLVQTIFSKLRLIDVDALASLKRGGKRARLTVLLRRVKRTVEELSRTLTRSYLTHAQTVRPMGGSAQ